MKLLLLLLVLPLSITANTGEEMTKAFADAQLKQSAADEFILKNSDANIEESRVRDLRELRRMDLKADLDEVLDIANVVISKKASKDVYFCKVAYQFNKLRGQENNVFRMRVKAFSEKDARNEIGMACLDFTKLSNKGSSCNSIKKKSTICINRTKPVPFDIKRWNWSY